MTKNMYRSTAIIVVALAAIFITIDTRSRAIVPLVDQNPNNIPVTSSNSSSRASSTPNTTTKGATNNTGSSQQQAPAATAAPSVPQTTGPCATILTLSEATSLMGGGTTPASANGVSDQSTDSTTVNCTYTLASDTTTIIAHLANTPVGSSDNDVAFGSGKPSDAATVTGYGNSAYWEQSSGLNILNDNNWYVVTYAKGGSTTLTNSEQLAAAAKL